MCQWLTPVTLAIQEAKIRIVVQSQPRQIILENTHHKTGLLERLK
jgi:hypothetical protein